MTFFLLSVDQPLGRIDKHSLSQETLMELLIEGITLNKYKICYSADNPADISEWEGVEFNEDNEITDIFWGEFGLWGSIDLKWLPPLSETVDFAKNALTGIVDLTCLPDPLEFLYLFENQLNGTVDLTKLPSGLVSLNISRNPFTGEADFSQLPESLKYLTVSHTHLWGEIRDFDGNVSVEKSNVIDTRKP